MNRIDAPRAQAAALDEFLQEHGHRFGRLSEVSHTSH
jgi:hypothetical protein